LAKKYGTTGIIGMAIVVTLIVLLTANIAYPYLEAGIKSLLGITPPGEEVAEFYYTGNLKVNLVMYDVYDDSIVTPTDIVSKIWHADESTVFGTVTMDGIDSITGQVVEADKAILYLSVDHAATIIYYMIDSKSEIATASLTALDPKDIDDDGTFEHYFKLDITPLTPLEAGETQKEITVNLYALHADVTGLDITSIINPSSADLSGASYIDLYAEAYVAGVTQGDGFKLARVELTIPNTANETYYEDGKVKGVWVSIVGDQDTTYKWTTPAWQPGQDRFLVWEATDVTQEIYGKDVLYSRGMGTTDVGKIKVHIKGANFAPGAVWYPTIKLTWINPAGTISTDTLAISFTDT